MSDRSFLAVVLAAGEGTRMKSSRAKVLHEVGGRGLLGHVIDTVKAAGADRLAVVVGPDMRNVAEAARSDWPECGVFVQDERKGTAHAVLAARAALQAPADDVIVLYGDTPLVAPATLKSVRDKLAAGADLVVLGFEPDDPAGYGRLIVEDGALVAIREDRDADPAERGIRLCNSGIMGFRGTHLPALLDEIGCDNAKHEYYLTDAVEIARGRDLSILAAKADADEVMGINDRAQLADCEAVFQARRRVAAMAAGVTLVAPETVFFSHDTALSPDVVVEPNVVFGPGVSVASGALIRAFSHLEGASVAENAQIGPYARLRPGAEIGAKARVGNFVEIKKAVVDEGAKVNHLTYIGDAHIGAAANIGAGTITCNYDGFNKYRTEIGAGAFIGSNSSLVAPVTIGDGAYVGSGSVITEDVEKDALAIGRGRQVTKPGRGAELRERLAAEKAARK